VDEFFKDPPAVTNMREGEVSLSDLWFGLHEKRVAAKEGVAITDDFKKRIREEYPPPASMDFRVNNK
jgi:hypothetical protein